MSKKQDPKSPITLVEDPFQLKTLEISRAQIDDESELELDTDLDAELGPELEEPKDSDAQLDSLSRAMAKEAIKNEKRVTELATLAVEDAQEAAARLAREISEDQALAQELANQAAAAQVEADPELHAAMPKLDVEEVASAIEALLFVSDKPLSLSKLREFLGPAFAPELFREAIDLLNENFSKPLRGIELVEVAGGFQLRTKPGRAALARKLAKISTQKLSAGAMESLAIVAYRQPVMKEDIDKVRGVDSSYFIHGLLEKKLIRISWRSELPGRPMLYETTDEFLHLFGLKDLQTLPPLRELEAMIPTSQSLNPEDPEYEDPRVKEMRKLVSQMKSDDSTSLVYNPREDDELLQGIRERVQGISITTPYLEEKKAMEKAAAELAAPSSELPLGSN